MTRNPRILTKRILIGAGLAAFLIPLLVGCSNSEEPVPTPTLAPQTTQDQELLKKVQGRRGGKRAKPDAPQ